GTWGGVGKPFCDGEARGIKGLRIASQDGVIRTLQVEYDICSQSLISRHGEYLVGTVEEIKLDYPAEYLQQIEGSYDKTPLGGDDGQPIIGITSITFKSNFKAYGPYGKLGINTFKSESGKIVGFWGGYSSCLESIGTSLRPKVRVRSYDLSKSRESRTGTLGWISGLQLGSPGKKIHLDVASAGCSRVYYMGDGGGIPRVRAVVSLVVRNARGLSQHQRGHVCDGSCELSQTDSSLAAHLLERLNSKLTPTTTEILTSSLWKVDVEDLPDGTFLSAGAFGSVLETEWLGQKHAKKVFIHVKEGSFKMESEVLAGLSHPHLLRIVGSSVNGRGKWKYALVMELMQGDLFDFLKEITVPLSILTALDLMLQVARGLKYLHSRHIVHRDLKSQNILVTYLTAAPELDPCLNAKLADFGLSKTKNSSTRYSHQTKNTGTRRWMAPEVFEIPEDEIDSDRRAHPFKADVYSFAIGTWGGVGNPFCDGIATGIKGLAITCEDGYIRSLQVEYDLCSQSFTSTHGGYVVGNVEEVKLNYPSEYLQQIEGSYDVVPWVYEGRIVIGITSITFKSNFKSYGPYGKLGKDTFKSESGKIVGFWGGYGACLDSIGVFTVNVT
ncbi:unnamed protein product, partial [Sphagnum jensenii]